jgi:cytochrome c
LTGRWSDATLDAFLADPQSFAPGTTMAIEPVTDRDERRELIRYLRTLS